MTRCELCGRACHRVSVTPSWWPYQTVCRRAGCREARDDALQSVVTARDAVARLVGAIRQRHEANGAPVGYRQDALAEMDRDDEAWWALEIAKRSDLP